ncbi:MAG: hypothetical protein J5990_07165 [Bacteroidales bacterium]|nr:hypothetical protein [Bacteroidales bacterium]
MEYNDELFTKLQQGWDEPKNACVDWANLTESQLGEYIKSIIESGIKPMLKALVNADETLINVPAEKVVLLSKGEFSLIMGLYEYGEDGNTQKKKELIKRLSDTTSILEAAKSFREINFLYYIGLDDCLSVCEGVQGFAIAGFQLINKDAAVKELGLHLICHELLHTIANSSAVNNLRLGDSMGDEAVNEFFARLATQYLIASGKVLPTICGITTTLQMKDAKGKGGEHDEWGTYGKRIKTSCDICKVVNSSNKLSALKALARFYFLGEERPK